MAWVSFPLRPVTWGVHLRFKRDAGINDLSCCNAYIRFLYPNQRLRSLMWWEERWSRVSLTYTVRFMACKYSIAIGSYTHDMDGGIWRSVQFLPNCFTSCTSHGSARDAYKRDDTDLPYIHPCNHPKLVSGDSCPLLCMQKGLPESLTLHNCLSMKKCFVEIKFVLVSCTFIHFFLVGI